jgi:hypothetical protein
VTDAAAASRLWHAALLAALLPMVLNLVTLVLPPLQGDFGPSDLLCPKNKCWVPLDRVRGALEQPGMVPISELPGALQGLGQQHLVDPATSRPTCPPREVGLLPARCTAWCWVWPLMHVVRFTTTAIVGIGIGTTD